MSGEEQRPRQPPGERFEHPDLQFDLEQAAAKLLAEPLGNRRHRQETLYRHGPLTIALFIFEQGASLPRHMAKGVVTVQVLQGRIRMEVDSKAHNLPGGSLLVLSPGVQHDVQAIEPSRMLLTVCLTN